MVLWRPTRPFINNTPKKCLFHYRGLEYKSRKSRNTWTNRQIWPWSTEWSRAKANRVYQENALVIANTLFQQHKRRLYTWTAPDGQHQNQIDYILCSQNGEALYSQQKQDWELTVAQIMNSLLPNSDLNWRKVGKTTRPFRCDLNQTPYDYTVEVRNRFKGLDLIDRVSDELWTKVHDTV